MKTNNSIQLESKEIKQIIAKALNIDLANVISTHYGFAVTNVPESVLVEKFNKLGIH